MDGKSLNINNQKIEELKAIFPDVFSEGKIDIDRLKAALGEDVFVHGEHYELSWAGKTEARKEIQKQTTATLMPDREGSIDFDNAQNIFIEGENLEVLRALQKSYFGKIKMIYIDPPYNTGNDSFVYPDDYTERREEYNKRTGITNEDGYLNKQDLWKKNSRENGQFHSVWLSMMYPRLYLARNLMREDGVIFVSIDDNEQANLKLLMDDVFGEENFVSNIIWQKKYAVSNDDPGIAAMHDYIVCYRKSSDFKRNLLPRTEKQLLRYKNIDNDPRGDWASAEYVSSKTKDERPTLWYPIIHPKTGVEVWPDESAVWRYSKENHERMVAEDRLYWGPGQSYEKPRLKRFLSEIQDGLVPSTWWTFDEVGHNDEGQKETAELLGKKVFSTPKPVRLLKRILEISCAEDDIVLDFFAGSSTTAHATLEINEEQNTKRKFILVQMPEAIEDNSEAKKAGYDTIATVSKARIRKVIDKIKTERAGRLDFNSSEKQHLGFKAYKIAPSNFNVWRNDVTGADAIIKQLEVFTQSEKQGSEHENMLHELILKSGRQLTVSIEKMQAASSTVYNVDNKGLFVFFDKLIPEFTDMCLALQPKKVICLNSCFAKDEDLTNFKLQLRDASIELTVI